VEFSETVCDSPAVLRSLIIAGFLDFPCRRLKLTAYLTIQSCVDSAETSARCVTSTAGRLCFNFDLLSSIFTLLHHANCEVFEYLESFNMEYSA